jgi:aspartate/methionine/tyrosine aminotransferase
MSKVRGADRITRFADSVFGEMTRLATEHGAVNLSQGFPDFAAPDVIKEAAARAILTDQNQYAPPAGTQSLRQAIAHDFRIRYGVAIDADTEVTVCVGSTEAMMATMLGCIDPGDEVIVFEPFYENYGPDAIVAGATPRYVRMHAPDWHFDADDLRRAFSNKTRAIVINSPNNPTGKVFSRAELELIARLCQQWDVIAISDEIYCHIVYDGLTHVPIASLDGMRDRTVTIGGLSKTYSVTGWRLGWCIAPPVLTEAIRKIHDFLTVAAPTPFHDAGAMALSLPPSYYLGMTALYQSLRDMLLETLQRHGFTCFRPSGAYYLMTDISPFGAANDFEFARHLITDVGVAAIPGSSFFIDPASGSQLLRFCFSKRVETLREADRRMEKLGQVGQVGPVGPGKKS